jgi:peptidoglycan-associated lipoprotein
MVDEELAAMTNHAATARHGSILTAAAVSLLLLAGCAKDPNAEPGGLSIGFGGGGSVVAAPGSPQDFVANVGDRVFFETDITELGTVARATLDAQAIWLTKYASFNFTIEGHADERGTREYNIALGARRAQNVKDYLVSKGISANRIQTLSYGKEKPVAVCNDAACWTQNRRAVTVLGGPGT